MLHAAAFAILAFVSAVGGTAAHAQTSICNSGTVVVYLAYALDANFLTVNGWHELKPGACEEQSFGYWLAVRQVDREGRLGIANYAPGFALRPVFFDNKGRAFCVNPFKGFNNALENVTTCGPGQERVLFGTYARSVQRGLFPATWSIATRPDAPIAVFGSGTRKQLDEAAQKPRLDPGDQLVLDVVGRGVSALLENTLPKIDLDKYKKIPSGPVPWSEVEDGARKRAKNQDCLPLYKSFYHCDTRQALEADQFTYGLCDAGNTEQLKTELHAYAKRGKEPGAITPIIRSDEKVVTWDFGKVPPTFHPPLADAQATAGDKAIGIHMVKDGDGLLTSINLFQFKRHEWPTPSLPPMPIERERLISEDKTAIKGALILECIYYRPADQRTGHRFYWYRQAPVGADPTRLKARVSNHPFLEFGAARDACPLNLDDAHTGRLTSFFRRST